PQIARYATLGMTSRGTPQAADSSLRYARNDKSGHPADSSLRYARNDKSGQICAALFASGRWFLNSLFLA
ncbi:MAG: hypothetical protein ACPGWR_17655, partial [Ardenticatenaceae bacterium]